MRRKRMSVKAIVFDMDGLIIDSERVIQMSWHIAGKELGYLHMDQDIYQTLGCNAKKRQLYFKATYGDDFPYETFLNRYRLEYQLYMETYGIPVKKGVYELIAYAKQKGIKIAVATSSSRDSAFQSLSAIHILEEFEVIVSGDMVKEAKPSPEIYQIACNMLKVNPADAIALEDSLHGIRAAFDAGMKPIFVPDLIQDSSDIDHLLYHKCNDLIEVIQILEN